MLKSNIEEMLNRPVWLLFLISWLVYFIGLLMFSQFVWDSNTYLYNFTGSNFEKYIDGIRRIDTVRYVLSPIWILLISAGAWLLIKAGLHFGQIEIRPT